MKRKAKENLPRHGSCCQAEPKARLRAALTNTRPSATRAWCKLQRKSRFHTQTEQTLEVWLEFLRPKPLYQECSKCCHELLWPHGCASRDICSCFGCFLLSFAPSPPSRLAWPWRAFQQHIHVVHASDIHPTGKKNTTGRAADNSLHIN